MLSKSFFKARMSRLFASSGKCFDVAIDHGSFNELSLQSGGVENMEQTIATICEAAPDAIQLTIGQAEILQFIPGRLKPSLILRTDVANVYGTALPSFLFSKAIDDAVEQALRLDAACVAVNLLMIPNQPELHFSCIENICRLKPACERYAMPLMIETMVMRADDAGGYCVDGDLNKILPLVRQARELGADVIKADPCNDVRQFHKVMEAARVPVLARGEGTMPDREIFDRTIELMLQGAHGIVIGRELIQHPNPKGMTKAFMAIVHEDVSVEDSIRVVNQSSR